MNTFTHSTTSVGPICGRPRLSILPWHEAARNAALPGLNSLLLLLLLGLSALTSPLMAQTPPNCGNSSGGGVSGPGGGNEEDPDCQNGGVAGQRRFKLESGDDMASSGAGGGVDMHASKWAPPPASAGGSAGFNTFKPYTGNLHRLISDLILFAGVGQHRLEWSRTFNSRAISPVEYFGEGQSWRHSYQWSIANLGTTQDPNFRVLYPSGTRNDFADIGDGLTFRTGINFPEYITRDSTTSTNFTLTLRNGFRYRFSQGLDTNNFAIYVMSGFYDTYGHWYAFSNDTDGRFVRVTEPAGRWLEVTYNTNGHISQMDASDGRTVTYSYAPYDSQDTNSAIVLTGADYGDGTEATYEYSAGQWPLLVHAVDPKYPGKGSNLRYTYWYEWGFIKEELHGVTEEVLVTNNGDSVVYANDATTGYTFGGPGGLQDSKTNALGGVKYYTYDTNSFPESVTDELGNVTWRTNSPMGNVIGRTYPDESWEAWTRDTNDNVLTYRDRLGHTNSYTRDTNALITRIDHPDSTYETFAYNSFQQITTHRLRVGVTNFYGYATNGLKTAFTNGLGLVTTYGYDSLHRLAYITNALGNITSYNYNDRGQITKITHPDSNWVAFGYDTFGNRIKQTNELGKVWTYEFNTLRQLTASIDPLGRTNLYEYALSANCCSGSGNNLTRVTSPSGRTVDYEYDLLGRKVAEIFAAGTGAASSNRFQYDAVGNLTNRIDGLSNSWQTVFDAMSRPIATIDPLGRTNTLAYDAAGNPLTVTRPDGTTSTNSYDSMNRLVKTVDPLNQTNSFTYNDRDQLVTLTDAKGNVTTWAYDALGRQTNKAYADSNGDTYRYDAVGNLTNHVNGASQSQTLTYDSRNRLLTTSWNDGSTSATARSYDAAGHLLVLTNSASIITNAYDDAGQLTSESQTISGQSSRTVAYAYNADGQRQSLTYPNGLVLTNDYTARGQLTSLTFDGPPPLVTYSYDLAGRRTTRAYENGVNAYYTNDNAGQLLALAHVKTNGGSVIVQVSHAYNELGNRTNRVESFTGYSSATDTYGYDSTDQLTNVNYSGGARITSFGFDPMGNLTNRQDTATGTNTFTANNLNQLTAIGASAITYDQKGNLTNRPGWLYTWNANDQLTIAEPSSPTNGAVKITFAYDGRSRCARRQSWTWSTNSSSYSLSSTFYLLYSGWNLIEERDSGTNVVTYVHGPSIDEVIAKFTSTNTVFYHGDAQNSTLALTDASANVLERYRYEAFGLPSIYDATFSPLSSSLYGVRHLFQGREWLAEIRLNDHRFRYYSPEQQRWLSRDPIEELDSINLYLFVYNSPGNYFDDSGLNGLGGIFFARPVGIPAPRVPGLSYPPRGPFPPEGTIENPFRPGSWGRIDPGNGKFEEVWRFDRGTPGRPGNGGRDHFHFWRNPDHLYPPLPPFQWFSFPPINTNINLPPPNVISPPGYRPPYDFPPRPRPPNCA